MVPNDPPSPSPASAKVSCQGANKNAKLHIFDDFLCIKKKKSGRIVVVCNVIVVVCGRIVVGYWVGGVGWGWGTREHEGNICKQEKPRGHEKTKGGRCAKARRRPIVWHVPLYFSQRLIFICENGVLLSSEGFAICFQRIMHSICLLMFPSCSCHVPLPYIKMWLFVTICC